MNPAAVSKFVERNERAIGSLIKSPQIPFQSANDFRAFKRSFALHLTSLGAAFMTQHPKADIIEIMINSIDPVNAPSPADLAEINSIFIKLDAAVTNLLLLSIPHQLSIENDGYMNLTEGAAANPLHGTSYAILNRITTQLSYRVEAEKCEYFGAMSSGKNQQESMATYIGRKLTAKQMLLEKFVDPISDATCRTHLIAGLASDPTSKTLMERLLQHQVIPQTLHETISTMEIHAREAEKSNELLQRLQPQNQALSMFDAPTKRNFNNKPPEKPTQFTKRNNERKSSNSSSSPSHSERFCFNHALKLACTSNPCPYTHLPTHKIAATRCPFTRCRKFKQGLCPFQHSPYSSSSSSVTTSLVTETSDEDNHSDF